jgi:carbamoyl-phosphate synthase large subunit
MSGLTIAVTGLNATDNPAPGVAVIRAVREAFKDCRIIGLSYDPLDPGNYMKNIADSVFLMPYPSCGAEVMMNRLASVCDKEKIDVLIPTLDAELPAYIKLAPKLLEMGIHTLLPHEDQLKLRSKANFQELKIKLDISIPKSIAITSAREISKLHEQFEFPVMVKGQFYDAYIAYSPMEAEGIFHRIVAKWGAPVIIQEFISGEEFDAAAVGDGNGGLIGVTVMRKMQLTDKGKAWGGITVAEKKLSSFIEDAMAKIKWRGPCEMEVMKSKDGQFYMIEINPRFPAWIYLSVGAGTNLPAAVVRLALGEKVVPMPPSPPGVMFLRYSHDEICTLKDYDSLSTRGELMRNENFHVETAL